jgi:D-aminopeptidase
MNESAPRARDAGVRIGALPPGQKNALTDLAGVRVGHATVSFADGATAARTGVTAIWPADGDLVHNPLQGGSYVLNGFGEITGRTAVDEWGTLSTPILLTATMSLGIVYHACLEYLSRRDRSLGLTELVIPVVGECDDSFLNHSRGFHVTREHVFTALDSAHDGYVEEGCVGAGTGMQCFEFKGGIGSSSRIAGDHTVGVLVLTNLGTRELLTIDGVPVGRELPELAPQGQLPSYWGEAGNGGSCIVVVGTDAPIDSRRARKLAKRSGLGLAKVGSVGANSSGELMFAFTTANRGDLTNVGSQSLEIMSDRAIDVLYQAVIEATEEAVVNALFAANTTTGRDGNCLHALPLQRTLDILARHGRLVGPAP